MEHQEITEDLCGVARTGHPAVVLCQHCHYRQRTRPRGLCFHCYNDTPWVRPMYPVTSPFGKRLEEDYSGPSPPAECPTAHPPGSDGKIAALAARAEAMQCLWHPLDAEAEE
jgi:hypothetical protein